MISYTHAVCHAHSEEVQKQGRMAVHPILCAKRRTSVRRDAVLLVASGLRVRKRVE
jgi:hypothetical protein